jgi:hypothetical protein
MSVSTEPVRAAAPHRRLRIAVADGFVFVARPDLAQSRSGPASLTAPHPDLLTVAVRTEGGGFVIEFEDGSADLCDGAELAAVLPVPLHDADVRMWLDWPDDRGERARLRRGLRGLAESTGATVWAAPEGGRTRIAPSCRDLAVVDDDGEPAVWQAYQPDPPTVPRYGSDPDGRLVPAGGLVLTGRPGVPLISASDARLRDLADRYGAVHPPSDTFVIDLPVLDDGRLAAWCPDGTLLALGPRHLAHLLETRGWQGEEVLLLADLTPRQGARLARYLREASAALGRELPIDAVRLADVAAGHPIEERPTPLEPDSYEARYGPDPTRTEDWTPAAMFLSRPNLVAARRRAGRHGLPWLPELPQVNDREFDVYVRSAWTAERAAVDGIPSPHPFLVGHLDTGLDSVRSAGSVRVQVQPHGAVDVMASGVEPPAEFAAVLAEADAYVLPARWLDRCRILLDDTETPVPALLCLNGATHGIDGLPEDVQTWPPRWRSPARAYAILPETVEAAGDSLRLYRHRPEARPGRLVELRVAAALAVDVAHTERRLAAPPSVRTILPELRRTGVDLLLSHIHFDRVRVSGLFTAADRRWRSDDLPRGATLSSLLVSR